ncbi:MAG: glutamate-1-semialdehyde 2,1-aminomutase [Halioglobus sp.]|jgi:glutamate-1-semialdehyde 2,1-aminomutase
MEKRTFAKSLKLQKDIHRVIPGGCHTYAKGDDQFPEFIPPLIASGKGCRVWDVDGNEYIEYGMGSRAVSLGHAYPSVNAAACKQLDQGSNFARPAAIELKAAEEFLAMVPGADMVKFAKNGSDVASAAIKLARAYTGRSKIAFCEDHPFFSIDDWFIGTTAMKRGIPTGQLELSVGFRFNDIDSVNKLFETHPQEIACFILEPEKHERLNMNFIRELQQLCRDHGSLLILDEMITGLRWHLGGAQTLYDIVPDLSTFGKAMGNGFAVSALAGKREIMELGGLRNSEERVFLLSTTHGAENHALAAFIAVVDAYKQMDVVDYLQYQGERLRQGMLKTIAEHNLTDYVGVHGHPAALIYSTADHENKGSQPFRTLFLQESLKRGLLAPSLVLSFSHKDEDVDQTLEIVHESLGIYRKALDNGIDQYLEGRPVQPVFRKFNHPEQSM